MSAFGLAIAGALLLWLPAFHFRIDSVTCASWPGPLAGALFGAAYLAAVALLTAAWLRAERAGWSLRRVLVLGAIVHAVALVAPPFASNDPLFYAAIGRALAHGAPAYVPLMRVLPPGDHLLQLLPEDWRAGTSPYGLLFDQLARAVALVCGDDLTRQLRAYQGLNLTLLVATAALVGRAFGPSAAALMLFCPLAIVDGTVNPHNDVLVGLSVAAFALLSVRRWPLAGLVALALGLLVKLSAVLLLGWELLRRTLALALARGRWQLRPRTVFAVAAGIGTVALLGAVAALRHHATLHAFAALVGDPTEAHPRFTRSVEALPRAALTWVAHAPLASYAVGLGFRVGGTLWIVYCALRAAASDEPLGWAGMALFGYYLLLHAFVQSWYLIPILPLATQLPRWARPALRVYLVSLTAYYALHLPLDCDSRTTLLVARELLEAAGVVLPAAVMLLAGARAQARASGAASPRGA
jgi:hypothetical protein